jgi:hypothetical protein
MAMKFNPIFYICSLQCSLSLCWRVDDVQFLFGKLAQTSIWTVLIHLRNVSFFIAKSNWDRTDHYFMRRMQTWFILLRNRVKQYLSSCDAFKPGSHQQFCRQFFSWQIWSNEWHTKDLELFTSENCNKNPYQRKLVHLIVTTYTGKDSSVFWFIPQKFNSTIGSNNSWIHIRRRISV